MSISSVLNSTANSNVKSTTSGIAKSAAASNSSSAVSSDTGTTSSFGNVLAQANLSAVPSNTLSPAVLDATVQSTTIQTSSYVFDPLGVVGKVPESNTFLQAIRAMLGKPAEANASETVASATDLTAQTSDKATTTSSASTSTPNLLSSIEAQLNYQSSAGLDTSTASRTATDTLTKAIEDAKTQTTALIDSTMLSTSSDLVGQYIANTSAAAAASAQSTLNKADVTRT